MFNMIVVMYINYDVRQRDRSCQDLSGRSWIKTRIRAARQNNQSERANVFHRCWTASEDDGTREKSDILDIFSCPQQHQLVKHIITALRVTIRRSCRSHAAHYEWKLMRFHLTLSTGVLQRNPRNAFSSQRRLIYIDFICIRPWERISKCTASTRWEKTLHFLTVSMQLRMMYKRRCHWHTEREITFYYTWNETTCVPKHIRDVRSSKTHLDEPVFLLFLTDISPNNETLQYDVVFIPLLKQTDLAQSLFKGRNKCI